MKYANIREEEIKIKVRDDFFRIRLQNFRKYRFLH